MDQQQQYTFVREGQMYHADKETIELIMSAVRYEKGETRPMEGGERSVAEFVFERGRATGRIGEGSANAVEQSRTTRAQGHGNEQSL